MEKIDTQTYEKKKKNKSFKLFMNPLLDNCDNKFDVKKSTIIIIILSLILRCSIGLGSYLGYKKPPLYGDLEAQRHWMELTINKPISQWYYFDLNYWGMDYPPLTAYHMYILGKIGSYFNKNWFEINISRGIESLNLKFFMRTSVLVSELLIFYPSVFKLVRIIGKNLNINLNDQATLIFIILNQPHLLLIDHGHFQYNSIFLGLFFFSCAELIKVNLNWASFWFILSINYKQMSLYYSLFIFIYILGLIKSIKEFVTVSATTVITNLVILIPFLKSKNLLKQILNRIFPLSRSLFEDKIANFWCLTNVLIKYKKKFTTSTLFQISLITTLINIIPVNIFIFKKLKKNGNKLKLLIYGFTCNAFSFYLFSYQVHEKSILIPLLPSTLILLTDTKLIDIIQWINNIGTFSLYPLLKKDGLLIQYFVIIFLINWLIGFKFLNCKRNVWGVIIKSSYVMTFFFHILDALFKPPSMLPDLWTMINLAISFLCFFIFWSWLNLKIFFDI